MAQTRCLKFDLKKLEEVTLFKAVERDTDTSMKQHFRESSSVSQKRRETTNRKHAAYQKTRDFSIHLCSFSSHAYAKENAFRFEKQAASTGYFDTITVYSPTNLPLQYDYAGLSVPQKFKYGPKIMKPVVVMDVMNQASQKDIVIYADISSYFHHNSLASETFETYIKDILKSTSKRLGFAMEDRLEYMYTRGDVFDLFSSRNSSSNELPQITADLFMMACTQENKDIMQAWLEIMTSNNFHYLLDSEESWSQNARGYVEPSSDTSIFSVLMKGEGFFMEPCPKTHDIIFPITKKTIKYY